MSGDYVIEISRLKAIAKRACKKRLWTPTSRAQFYSSIPLSDPTKYMRLLYLHGINDGPYDSPLTGHVRVAELENLPSFMALSYVWGEKATPSHVLHCQPQGFNLEITESCHAALFQVRRRFGTVALWVDAVCIDQGDDIEKQSQIPHMRTIYSTAESVVAWLGPGTKTSNETIRYIQNMVAAGSFPFGLPSFLEQSARKRLKAEQSKDWEYSACDLSDGNDPIELDDPGEMILDELLNREWVRRAWTFQELILARHPIILCGGYLLSWDDLLKAMMLLDSRGFRDGSSKLPMSGNVRETWFSIIILWLEIPRQRQLRFSTPNTEHDGQVSYQRLNHHLHWTESPKGRWIVIRVRALLLIFAPVAVMLVYTMVTAGLAKHLLLNGRIVYEDDEENLRLRPFHDGDLIWLTLAISGSFAALFLYSIKPILHIPYMVTSPLNDLLSSSRGVSSNAGLTTFHVIDGIRMALNQRKSSEPHDMAFSVFGILESLGRPVPQPDYTQPLHETYKHLFRLLLECHPSSFFMVCDSTSRGVLPRPSWVPDWSLTGPSPWLLSRVKIGTTNGATPRPDNYATCFNISDNILTVRCSFHGTITYRTRQGASDDKKLESFWIPEICHWFAHVRQTCQLENSNDALLSALFVVITGLFATCVPETGKDDFQVFQPDDFRAHKGYFYNFRQVFLTLEDLIPRPVDTICSIDPTQNRHRVTKQAISLISQRLREEPTSREFISELPKNLARDERCFFSLDNGFVGTGLEDIKIGDKIFLIDGVPVPMALREVAYNQYKVVGAVLVHGLMHWNEITVPIESREIELV